MNKLKQTLNQTFTRTIRWNVTEFAPLPEPSDASKLIGCWIDNSSVYSLEQCVYAYKNTDQPAWYMTHNGAGVEPPDLWVDIPDPFHTEV